MTKRTVYCLVLLALTGSLCGRSQSISGTWRENSLRWAKPPAELHLKERTAEAALLYFSPDHVFVLVYGLVIQGPRWETLSRGDGRVVYLGKWVQDGATLRMEYRLVSRTVLIEGETLPGPIEKKTAAINSRWLLFNGKHFKRDSCLDGQLRDIATGEQARITR